MKSFEIIAIFLIPIIGVFILNKRYKFTTKDLIYKHIILVVFSNLTSLLIFWILKGRVSLAFTYVFFIKYSLLNIFSVIIYTLLIILMKEYLAVTIKIDFRGGKNEKS